VSKLTSMSKALPKFRPESQEREFWEAKGSDATQYFAASKMVVAKFKNLKPSTTRISLRLTDSLLDGISDASEKNRCPVSVTGQDLVD
jgi:predicted DNA binding CopG/RHH family protein